MEKKKYAVFTLVTENFFEPANVMIYSFLQNNKWFDGDIVIICTNDDFFGLRKDSRDYFVKRYGDMIKFRDVNLVEYYGILQNITKNKLPTKTFIYYFKFEMFKEDEYDVKLYLDSDIVVNANIEELFRNCTDKFLVVEDPCIRLAKYFNSGVLVAPKSAIPEGFYKTLMNAAETFDESFFKNIGSAKGHFGEQDIYNELITEKEFIGEEYNFSPKSYHSDLENNKIFHYCGAEKPWNNKPRIRPADTLYHWYYYAMIHNFNKK